MTIKPQKSKGCLSSIVSLVGINHPCWLLMEGGLFAFEENKMALYVLEYSKKQDAYHIQPIESRCANLDWQIICEGDYGFVLDEYYARIGNYRIPKAWRGSGG